MKKKNTPSYFKKMQKGGEEHVITPLYIMCLYKRFEYNNQLVMT